MTGRLEEAKREVEAGNAKRALRLLWQVKADAAARGDVAVLQQVVELAETVRTTTGGRRREDAFLLIESAKHERTFLVRQAAEQPPSPAAAPRRSPEPTLGPTGVEARIEDLERKLEAIRTELAEVRALAASEATWTPAEARLRTAPSEARVDPTPSLRRRVEPPPPPPPLEREPATPWVSATRGPSAVEERLAALKSVDLSDLLGARALAWAGGIVTLLGIVFFFVLAVDRGWLSPELRCLLGAAASAGVYAFGLWAWRRYGTMEAALAGAGAGIAGGYATLFAATGLYEFLSRPAALAVAAGIAAVGVITALAWNAQTTAALGLVGALAGPLLIEEGDPSVLGLAFVALVFAAAIAVTLSRDWLETLAAAAIVSFPQPVSFFVDHDPTDEWDSALAVGAFALLFVLAGVGVGLGLRGPERPRRPIMALALVAASILLVAGLALDLQPSSPTLVAAILGSFWVLYLGLAIAFQLARGGERLERLTISLTLATTTVAFIGAHTWLDSQRDEGYALLTIAGVTLLPLLLLVRRGPRDLTSLLWATSLTVAAVAGGYLLTGDRLTLVWSAQGALLSFLAWRAREARLQLAAAAYLLLALLQTLGMEARPEDLFREIDAPEARIPAILFVAAGAIVFGLCFRRQAGRETRGTFLDLPIPSGREGALIAWTAAGGLALYGASYAVLGLCQESFGDPGDAFERGQAAVTSLWASAALATLVLALRRRSSAAYWAAMGVFGLALGKALFFDGPELGETNFGYSLFAVGALAGAAGYANGLLGHRLGRARLSDVDLDPVTVCFVLASVVTLVPALWIVLDGRTAGVDRAGAGLLLAGLAYAALASTVFRSPGLHDFTTLLWLAAVVLAGLGLAEDLLDGTWLVAAWSALAAGVAWLARRTREDRLFIGSAAFVVPALGLAIGVEARPDDLFRENAHPAAGVPSVLFVTGAIAALATCLRWPHWRDRAYWLAGGLGVYAASLSILGAFQWIADDDPDSVATAFQRGHTAVSSFWAILGLALLAVGLRRRWAALRLGGLALFAVALAKIFLYDLSTLSSLARALSFLGVGSLLLLAALLYQRLTEDRTPETP